MSPQPSFRHSQTNDHPTEPGDDLARRDLLRYASDPVAFVEEVLGRTLWAKQQEVLVALRDEPQVTVRSGHGVGKTFVAATAALWWVYSHRPSLVLTTAPTARQVEHLLWGEIGRLCARARVTLPGRCLQARLEASLDQTAIGLTTNEPEKFAGWHSEHLLVIVDEASGVPDPIYEVLQGTLTSAHTRLLLIGNPTRTSGYFHQTHHSSQWRAFRIGAPDTPNFAAAGAIPCPWLVTPAWVAARREEWGEASDPYRVRVLGEFPHADASSLIPLEWLEAAEDRGVQAFRRSGIQEGHDEPAKTVPECRTPDGVPALRVEPADTVLGVDVARYGDCETVLALRRVDALLQMVSWQGADLMQSCGRIVRACQEWCPRRVVVDAVGVGGGVLDRLRELQREGLPALLGVQLVSFQSGGRALAPDQFAGTRDEAYWGLRQRLANGELILAPPAGTRWGKLIGQLATLQYGYTSRGQVKIESKDERRRRGLPSPDHADAVMLAFAPVLAGPRCRPVALGCRRPAPDPFRG